MTYAIIVSCIAYRSDYFVEFSVLTLNDIGMYTNVMNEYDANQFHWSCLKCEKKKGKPKKNQINSLRLNPFSLLVIDRIFAIDHCMRWWDRQTYNRKMSPLQSFLMQYITNTAFASIYQSLYFETSLVLSTLFLFVDSHKNGILVSQTKKEK